MPTMRAWEQKAWRSWCNLTLSPIPASCAALSRDSRTSRYGYSVPIGEDVGTADDDVVPLVLLEGLDQGLIHGDAPGFVILGVVIGTGGRCSTRWSTGPLRSAAGMKDC